MSYIFHLNDRIAQDILKILKPHVAVVYVGFFLIMILTSKAEEAPVRHAEADSGE